MSQQCGHRAFDFIDVMIGQLLHVGLAGLAHILAQVLLLLGALERLHRIAACVADAALGIFGNLLRHLAAARAQKPSCARRDWIGGSSRQHGR